MHRRWSRIGSVVVALLLAGGVLLLPGGTAKAGSKDGIHKGIVKAEPNGKKDSLGLLCKFELSYALWTLLDEPVEDYLFK